MGKLETTVFDASEAKNNFGKLIDAAQRKPVAINRRGRRVAFVISPADMEAIEDFYLGMRATEAMKRGSFLSIEETRKFFDSILKGNARRTHTGRGARLPTHSTR